MTALSPGFGALDAFLVSVEGADSGEGTAQPARETQQEVQVSIIMARGKTMCPRHITKHFLITVCLWDESVLFLCNGR